MKVNTLSLLLSNMRYGLISHSLVCLFGIVRAIIIPVMLGVINFGYWQFYILYAGFVGIFTFGFNDGIYLRYGGKLNDELPWKRLRGAFFFYFLTLLLISFVLFITLINLDDVRMEKLISLKYIIISIVLSGAISLNVFLFQITNQIKKYSIYILIDKIFFVLLLFLIYFFYSDYNFEYLMIIDCVSKLFLIFIVFIDYRKYIFGRMASFRESWEEFCANIGAGIKLMLANLLAMLILNISRIFIEFYYTTEEFSVFSFGITLTNLGLLLVSAISVVLYPALKQLKKEEYMQFYAELSDAVTFAIFMLLFSYYPIYIFIINFIPDFKDVLIYFNILLVVSLLQIKMNVIINTFYKVLRRERSLLIANFESLVFILFLSTLVILFYKTINAMAFAMLVVVILRVYRSELYIKNIVSIQNHGQSVLELSILLIFILITQTMSLTMSFIMLSIFFVLFANYQKTKITGFIKMLRTKK